MMEEAAPGSSKDTALALVRMKDPDVMEVLCHEGRIWTTSSLAELIAVRVQMAAGRRVKALVVMPQEIDFELSSFLSEHYDPATMPTFCRVESWAVQTAYNHDLLKIYFKHYPNPVPCGIFMTEEEAREWLLGQP
jgi:hypothetical protein